MTIKENSSQYDVAIVIPTLNEEEGIGKTIEDIKKCLEQKYTYKIIVVDGLSTDKTIKIAQSFNAEVIKQRRKGYGDALQAGFFYVNNNLNSLVTVMLDADGTYEINDIPKMIEIIKKRESDFVIGNRFVNMDKHAMTRLNKFGNKVLSFIARQLLKIPVHDTQCGLRAFRSDLTIVFASIATGMPFATEMLANAKSHGVKIKEIPTSYHKRIGDAKLNPIQDGKDILTTIIRLMRDTRPLSLFGGIGLLFMSVGVISGIEVIIEYLENGEVTRIPTTILSTLLILLGVQSISLGLISDLIKNATHNKNVFYDK